MRSTLKLAIFIAQMSTVLAFLRHHGFQPYKMFKLQNARLPKNLIQMGLKTGIVGMPNVGKSTLFNALTEQNVAQAANFPFCTIEPNVGVVAVPDPRLDILGGINKSRKVVPTSLEFVDIAGLVKGASKGEGLGNQFLANIRQTDAIVHVVRCFEDDNVIHVDGSVNPVRDMEIINLELALADLEQVEKRLQRVSKEKGKANLDEKNALEKIRALLDQGKPSRFAQLTAEEQSAIKNFGLLTSKPVIYACNVADSDLAHGNAMVKQVEKAAKEEGASVVIVSAQVESELAALSTEDKKEFLESLGVEEQSCGLRALIRAAYDLLGLQTYFTSGETETKAWTFKRGMKAPQAAGIIHSDFERGFIRAEIMSYEELVAAGSEKVLKEQGRVRSEGKDYVVQEGDVILFRFNV